ncbi:uncharacterized protein LOC105195936 isoform X2 [Solenopsis invicta]|uniref:uncharacterized protein LOC105195936 isoform X2 n=1 Tax=Solenopsis invicta TaxID=13686 RepID=UPI00193CF735|nr:uncharacterized protein LOC105195936 isoform X2 [Solenopsis invicta]
MTFVPSWQNCPLNSYYTINRILLLCIGLWPFQKSISKHVAIALVTIILAFSVIFQLTTFITTKYNIDILLRVLTYTIPWLAYMLKYNAQCLNIKRIRSIMERVLYDWKELSNAQEIEIIKEYADIGRFITLLTTLTIYIGVFSFIVIQFLPNILQAIISSKNNTDSRQLPILIECFIDQQKYFFLLLLAIFFCVACGLTTVAATETLVMSYVHHACGLFEIASYRIERALFKDTAKDITSSTQRSSIICQGIINGFTMYKRAIEFIDMIQITYKWAYSILLPLGVLSLSVNLFTIQRTMVRSSVKSTKIITAFNAKKHTKLYNCR